MVKAEDLVSGRPQNRVHAIGTASRKMKMGSFVDKLVIKVFIIFGLSIRIIA